MCIAAEQLGMNYLVEQLGCTALVLVAGFTLNKLWTFGPPVEETSSPREDPPGHRKPAPPPQTPSQDEQLAL